MLSMFGLAPRGMIKRNAVALIIVLDFVFADASDFDSSGNSNSSNNNNNNNNNNFTSIETKRKLVDSKLLPLICVLTRVLRVGGMLDDDVIATARRLFKNFLAHTPEHLRQHNETMLAKDNQAFFT